MTLPILTNVEGSDGAVSNNQNWNKMGEDIKDALSEALRSGDFTNLPGREAAGTRCRWSQGLLLRGARSHPLA